MLVCIDKITCVRMHELITRYWDEHIKKLERELEKSGFSTEDETTLLLKDQIIWMQETRATVVISEEQGEVEKFRKWGLDILPHRRLIKEGMDLPESMRKKPQFHNMQRMALDDAFKVEEHPFRIAIVCAMWLTGFDVPSLSTLYLDKPLKAHTLMQAIARANRVYKNKNNGLIVDYCGILKHLRKALATYAGTQPGDGKEIDPARPDEELLADLAETINFIRTFLKDAGAPLANVLDTTSFVRNAAILACKEAANENDETRKRFEVMCREVFKKFKACINVKGINTYRKDRDAINIIYKRLQRDRERADISDIIRQLHEVVDRAIEPQSGKAGAVSEVYDISQIDFDRLKLEFERSNKKKSTVQDLKQAIDKKLFRLLQQNPLRTDFQAHYEQIVADYNREKDRVTIEQTFEALIKLVQELDEEEKRAVRVGLDEESLAIFDLLIKKDLSNTEVKQIKEVSIKLLETTKGEIKRIDQWKEKEATRDAIKKTIRDFLWSDQTGLPTGKYTEGDVRAKVDDVFRHVFRAYPTVPSPIYSQSLSS